MARMFRISEDSNELIYDFDIIFFIANIWGLVHDLKFQQVLVCVWAVTFWEFDVTRVDHSALLAQKYGEDVHKKPAPFWKDPPRGDDFFSYFWIWILISSAHQATLNHDGRFEFCLDMQFTKKKFLPNLEILQFLA